jgi:polyketide cyclase/dehydrase/lipid transport protein
MPRPYASGIVPADVETVWRTVRDFNGLPGWHPAIETSELEPGPAAGEPGAVRRLVLGDGGVVREVLVRLDDLDHSYTYQILESPFPVRSYISTIRIAPVTATGESFVEWWSEYDSDGDDESQLNTTFADGVYGQGITGLATKLSAG